MDKYERKINVNPVECKNFLERIDMPVLSDRDCVQQSNQITKQEIYKNLKEMKNNKAPGNDGVPKEFYLAFFDYLGDDLVNCLNRNFEVGELTSSQRQAIITLIAKPGKDTRQLKSWRPISLLNVDVKLLSLTLVSRIKNVLPNFYKL